MDSTIAGRLQVARARAGFPSARSLLDDGDAVGGMVKQCVTMTPTHLVLAQFNPPREIEIARNLVKAVHRIILAGTPF